MKPFSSYSNPALAVDLIVFGYAAETLSVLLLQRSEAPFAGAWTLPGAFVGLEETLADAGSRVLRTKLGVASVYREQLFTFDDPARDPRGRVVSVAYYALVNGETLQTTGPALAPEARWHPLQDLPPLGFDHRHLLDTAYARLQSKMLYHPVGFELLDTLFTLPELHRLYECVLNTPIDRRNFTRKILASEFVVPAGVKRTGGANRHPDLYQFNRALQSLSLHLNLSKP